MVILWAVICPYKAKPRRVYNDGYVWFSVLVQFASIVLRPPSACRIFVMEYGLLLSLTLWLNACVIVVEGCHRRCEEQSSAIYTFTGICTLGT